MNTHEETEEGNYDSGHTNPANWKWGLFYFNPKDKRIFPPKRFGVGWTINFANLHSVYAFILVILLIILFSLWLNAQAM